MYPGRHGIWWVVLAASLVTESRANPPDKSGVKPSVLSLPAGPGSIEGLGKAFQPQLNTGTATYNIPLKLPPGTAGFAPTVELTYNSGGGNSVLGQGWNCTPTLSIDRQTEKGFPRYRDTDQGGRLRDVFVFRGEELVPLSDGTYRCENETEFRRFRPVTSLAGAGVDSWLIEDRNGTRHWLGRHAADLPSHAGSRVVHPAPPLDGGGARSAFEQTYQWLEDTAEDVNGNRIEYAYRSDSGSPGVLYLEEIRYFARDNPASYHAVRFYYESRADRLSDCRAGFLRVTGWRCREVSVASVYGERIHPVRSYVLSYRPADGALGDVDAASPLLRRRVSLGLSYLFSVTEHDAARAPGGAGRPGNFLPPMRFAYAGFYLQTPAVEVLQALAPLAQRLRPDEANPLALGPARGVLTQSVSPDPGGSSSVLFDLQLENARVQFADMNGDGLPDLLNTETDDNHPLYRVAYNHGNGRFGISAPVAQSPVTIHLADTTPQNSVTLTDANGDGLADLVQIVDDGGGLRTRIHPNVFEPGRADGITGFANLPTTDAPTPLEVGLSAPNVRQMDLDFDKRPDVLACNEQGLVGYRSEPGGGWSNLGRQDWSQFPGDGRLSPDYAFSRADLPLAERVNPLVHLADMNGDRLLDLVQIVVAWDHRAEVRYRPLVGPMSWGPEVTLQFALPDGNPSGIPASLEMPGLRSDALDFHNHWGAIQLLDVNGDGLTDVVYLEQNQSLRLFFNCAGHAMLGPFVIVDTPVYQPDDPGNPTILRAVDINGNGSTDLVYYHAVGGVGLEGFRYVDFCGGQKPGLLQVIDNGIGRRSFIRYRSATDDLLRSRRQGHPWLTVMPNPVWVVAGTVDDLGLDLNGDGEPDRYATSVDYRDGYYDGFERQFRGFAYAQKVAWGDDVDSASGLPTGTGLGTVSAPTTVTRYRFMTGSPDTADNDQYVAGIDTGPRPIDETTLEGGREEESLKGKPVWEEAVDGTALLDPTADFDRNADAAARSAHTGDPYGLAASRCTPNKYVYSRTHSRWAVRRLYRPSGVASPRGRLLAAEPGRVALVGQSITFPVLLGTTTELIEANALLQERFAHPHAPFAARPPVITSKEFDYDDFGNTILECDWGVVSGLSPLPDDDRVIRRTFVLSRGDDGAVDRWIVNRIAMERTEDENGVFANETRHYYDGPDCVGLPLGQIGTRGLEVRTERRVKDPAHPAAPLTQLPTAPGGVAALKIPGDPHPSSPEWIPTTRKAYDAYGNATVVLDPLAVVTAGGVDPVVGHAREFAYDPVFHTFPIEERIQVGGGKPDLVMRAEYQRPPTATGPEVPWGFGVMTRASDFNANATDYYYDTFARLTAVVKPGDTEALPTTLFTYRPADPHRGVVYEYDRTGALTFGTGPLRGIANTVQTDARETAGQAGVFTALSYTDGNGNQLLTLTEDDTPGMFNVKGATRYNLRGAASQTFQPYRLSGSGFALPAPTLPHSDLFADGLGRVLRTVLPPETEAAPDDRRETRTHYQPLTEVSFDEEDLASSDPAQSHLNTPMIQYKDGLARLIGVDEAVRLNDDGTPASTSVSWPTRYEYDLNDKLVHLRDSQNNEKWFRYDGLGRKRFMNDPDRGTMTYMYDDASNLRETVDAKAQRIAYTYDGVNRLLTEDYRDEGQPFSANYALRPAQPLSRVNRPDVAYFYDVPETAIDVGNGTVATARNTRGFLAYVWDLTGEEHTSYDARGRVALTVKRVKDPIHGQLVSFRTGYAYDSLDRVTQLTYPDDDHVLHHYGNRSLLRGMSGGHVIEALGTSNIVADIRYQASDQLAQIDYGNRVRTSYAYDPRLRLRELHTVSPRERDGTGGVDLIRFSYRFDGASNIRSIADRRPASVVPLGDPRRNTQVFAYDDLYRLTRAAYNPSTLDSQPSTNFIAYRYDRIGNLLEQTSDLEHRERGRSVTDLGTMDSGGVAGRAHRVGRTPTDPPGPHALSSIRSPKSEVRDYPYDGNGNMLVIDGLTNTWDFKDRLVRVQGADVVADYAYDHTDRRIVKRVEATPPPHSEPGGDPGGVGPSITLYIDKYSEVRPGEVTTKYLWNGQTRVARLTAQLSPGPRVQRIRYRRGWNLIAPAVDGVRLLPSPDLLFAARWDQVGRNWRSTTSAEALAAHTVLWLRAQAAGTLTLSGLPVPLRDRGVSGSTYLAAWGFEEMRLTNDLWAGSSLWLWDADAQGWRNQSPYFVGSPRESETTLGAAGAAFLQADTSVQVPSPHPTLQVHYYHQDHLGSSSVVADAKGGCVWEAANYPFGRPRNQFQTRTRAEPYSFTQKERDAESNYSYFEARYLLSEAARFLSVDPLVQHAATRFLASPQSLRTYSYCDNRPLRFTDPRGMQKSEPDPVVQGCVDVKVQGTVNFGVKGEFNKHASGEFSYLRVSGEGSFQVCYNEHYVPISATPRSAGVSGELGPRYSLKVNGYSFTGKHALYGKWDSSNGLQGGQVSGFAGGKSVKGLGGLTFSGELSLIEQATALGSERSGKHELCVGLSPQKTHAVLPYVGPVFGSGKLCVSSGSTPSALRALPLN